jgi:hypothetical protein
VVCPKTKATLGYEFKTEPNCIHYKHSKGHLAIYGKKMNAEHQFNITEIIRQSANVTPLYQEQINANPSLGSNRKAIDFGPTYIRIQTPWKKERIHSFYYKAGLDLAGSGLATRTEIWKKEIL